MNGFVLKKDSPSCGMERVKVYSGDGPAERGGRGVFAAALPDGRAMALKVLDGSSRPLPVVAAAVLRSLGAGGAALEAAGRVDVLGGGVPVGTVEPLVGLARHPAADS